MSEETFRIIVAGSVLAAMLAFVVQAIALFAIAGVTRKLARNITTISTKVESVATKLEPMLHHAEPTIIRTEFLIDSLSTTTAKIRLTIRLARPIFAQTTVASRQVGNLIHALNQAAGDTELMVQELCPGIDGIRHELSTIVRSVKVPAAEVEDLLHDVSNQAPWRWSEISHAGGRIVRRFERMSNVVLRPVRVARGIAAGTSAAIGTWVHSEFSRRGHG